MDRRTTHAYVANPDFARDARKLSHTSAKRGARACVRLPDLAGGTRTISPRGRQGGNPPPPWDHAGLLLEGSDQREESRVWGSKAETAICFYLEPPCVCVR